MSKFGMVFKGITKAKESTHVQVKREMRACVLLWSCGYCSQRVCSYWTHRPSCHPAKQVPGRVPELEKTLGAVYQEWSGVLWRRQVWL